MKPGIFLFAAFAAGLAVSPALACSPAEMEPSADPVRGAHCAISWQVTGSHMVGLGEAQSLPGGFALQDSFEGSGCGGASSFVLSDCNSGEVVILGEMISDLMQPELSEEAEKLPADLEALAAKGQLSLAAAVDAAERRGLLKARWASTGDRLRMSGKTAVIDCACKTFWPQAGGKS